MTKEPCNMVLCMKCFEEKHDQCMGKAGLFDCDCPACMKKSSSEVRTKNVHY